MQNRGKDGSFVTQLPDGTIVTETQTADSRFGLVSPITSSSTRVPSGLTRTESRVRTVSLANPNDPLSIVSLSNQRLVNGHLWTEDYDAASKTWTLRTPAGRRTFRRVNDKGDLVEDRAETLLSTFLATDTRGRLGTLTQGTRQSLFSYFSSGANAGYLQTSQNPLPPDHHVHP